jgi:adenylate cyclase
MHNPLLQLLFEEQKIGYIVTNSQYTILDYEGESSLLVSLSQDLPTTLFDLVPELMGCEDILQDILDGVLPRFQLENLNRELANQEIGYINIAVLRYVCEEAQPLLLVVISDTSAWTTTQQILTQQRNDLKLLQKKLDDTNQRLEFILQRYVPREVGNALLENRIVAELGGDVREITALFADLRNYTSISEKLTPTETIELLHVFLDIATSAIAETGGVVVNYMGDAVMAIFNAPNEQPDHARRAVQAGLTMQIMANVYQEYKDNAKTQPPFRLGVGINTGQALVGNIGAQWHYQYTAIGDTINVASRLCSNAQPDEVLIGANTYAYLTDRITAEALPPIKFKGKSQAMTVYRVTALADNSLLETLANST